MNSTKFAQAAERAAKNDNTAKPRAPRSAKSKPTITQEPSVMERLSAACDDLLKQAGIELSPARAMLGFTLSLVAMCGVWWLATPVILGAGTVVATITGFGFLGFVASVIGLMITWYVSWSVGSAVNAMMFGAIGDTIIEKTTSSFARAKGLSPARVMFGAPDWPVAPSSRVSLVERSPSTVTALKLLRV